MTLEEARAAREAAKQFDSSTCESPHCRRMGGGVFGPNWFDGSVCVGYHCGYCAAPTGMMGHPCEVRDVLEAAGEL